MAQKFPILTHDLIVLNIPSIFAKPRQTLGAQLTAINIDQWL